MLRDGWERVIFAVTIRQGLLWLGKMGNLGGSGGGGGVIPQKIMKF